MSRRDEVLLVVYRPGPEFLVLLRSPESHGYWHLVAGGVERGEAPDEDLELVLELIGSTRKPASRAPFASRPSLSSSATSGPTTVRGSPSTRTR